jgi:hypothetical protein
MDQNSPQFIDNGYMNRGSGPQPVLDGSYTVESQGDIPEGEPHEVVEGDTKLVKFPDGSAYLGDQYQNPDEINIDPADHDQNLAAVLPLDVVAKIGYSLKSAITDDMESQSSYFDAIANTIKLMGLNLNSDSEKDDLPFKGASSIYSTALFESSLDLLASSIASLFPSQGMVDCVINGENNDQLRDLAYRKKAWFNYYLTNVAKEFKKESKRTLLWAILCGSCYKKVFIDPTLGRPTSMFIRPEDFIVNREFATHLAANRKTHIIHMTERDLQIRKMSGMYRDIEVSEDDGYGNDQEIQSCLNEISGVASEGSGSELDTKYILYECHVDYYIPEDPLAPEFELAMPYIITLDAESGKVLAIRRNWEKDDFLKKKKEYFVNYSLLPSLDGEGYGMVNYAGRLAESATMITRQLINTGTYANFPGGIYAAGIRIENNNLRPSPGEFVPIQTGGLPINQVIEALPYKEPSQSLKELLVNIEDSIRKPSAIINQKVAELAPRAPMGSVLAMLESLQKVPNAILQGFHESFGQELMLFNDRFADWLPEGKPYPFIVPGGEHVIMKDDFRDHVIVIPASDPSSQNSTYRFMKSEIILNQAKASPELHNMHFAFEYFYKNMGLSPEDIHQLLPDPKKDEEVPPFSGDPITEDQYLLTGKPVTATVAQDHDAHIAVHQLVVSNTQATPQAQAAATAHIQEHEGLKLLVQMQQQMGFEMPADPSQIPPEMQNQIAVAAAQIAKQKLSEQQGSATPPPMDPGFVMDEDSKRKAEIGHQRIEVDRLKISMEEEKVRAQLQIEQMKLQQKEQTDLIKADLEDKKMEMEQVSKDRDRLLKEVQYLKSTIDNQPKQQEGIYDETQM